MTERCGLLRGDRPTAQQRDEARVKDLLYPTRTVQATPIHPPVKVRPRDVTPRAQTTTPRRST